MTEQFLLVAEADKIQDFVFRSARRREVVGASYLLKKFCEDIGGILRNTPPVDVLTSAGGSFRLVFASREDAECARIELVRSFEAQVGGTITTAIVEYDESDPASGIGAGNEELRKAKVGGRPPEPVWHLPQQALCASCGTALATRYEVIYAGEPGRYVCDLCHRKAEENYFGLFADLRSDIARLQAVAQIGLPENATEAETYAWDPRNYVAYLLADGNHMGKLFGSCQDPATYTLLSDELPAATTQALAEAVEGMLADQHPSWDRTQMPCLPLIMGGDDLFVLMPALWAYDVAARFCAAYEALLGPVVEGLHAKGKLIDSANPDQPPPATIGVAVVICKAKYPYKLAHQHGEQLLERVKERSKQEARSMLAVDLITGGQIASHGQRRDPLILFPEETEWLLRWRYALRNVPSRTLEQLRAQLERAQSPDGLLQRVRQLSRDRYQLLSQALDERGDQGVLELLNHWDFAHDQARKLEHYASGGEG